MNYYNEIRNKLIDNKIYQVTNRTLRRIRQYYIVFEDKKWSQVATQLSWSHYTELLPLKEENKILYYINISIKQNLSRNELRTRIKNKEYERLDENTKLKLINKQDNKVGDFIKNPILIKNRYNYKEVSEKTLKQ